MNRFVQGLLLAGVALGATARAQVTENPQALSKLAASTHPSAPHTPGASRPAINKGAISHSEAGKPAAAHHGPPSVPALPLPQLAAAPPPMAQLPPAPVVALRPVAKPIPPKPVPGAIGSAIPLTGGGLRVTFAAGSSDMNPAMEQAIRAFGAKAAPGPVDLDAYSAGNPQDPSTPRRLSLARLMAARDLLIDAGIKPSAIYLHAHGPESAPNLPADRLELSPTPARS